LKVDSAEPGSSISQLIFIQQAIQGVDSVEAACRLHTASEVSHLG